MKDHELDDIAKIVNSLALTTSKVVAIDLYRLTQTELISIKKRLSTIIDLSIGFRCRFLSITLVKTKRSSLTLSVEHREKAVRQVVAYKRLKQWKIP